MRLPADSLVESGILQSRPTWVWVSGLWLQSRAAATASCLPSVPSVTACFQRWAAVGEAGAVGWSGGVCCSGASLLSAEKQQQVMLDGLSWTLLETGVLAEDRCSSRSYALEQIKFMPLVAAYLHEHVCLRNTDIFTTEARRRNQTLARCLAKLRN